jgi:hypothetical protein
VESNPRPSTSEANDDLHVGHRCVLEERHGDTDIQSGETCCIHRRARHIHEHIASPMSMLVSIINTSLIRGELMRKTTGTEHKSTQYVVSMCTTHI